MFLHNIKQKKMFIPHVFMFAYEISSSCNNNNNNNNEFIPAYPFYMKLALRPKIIYTKRKYSTMRYRERIS